MAQITGSIAVFPSGIFISNRDGYDIISLEGTKVTTKRIGAPQLPVFVKNYVVPINAVVDTVVVLQTNRVRLDGTFMPYPAQEPIPINSSAQNRAFAMPDSTIYYGRTPYPNIRAEITSQTNQLGFNIVTITFYPVEYDPANRKIYLNSFDYTVVWTIDNSLPNIVPERQSRSRAERAREMIETMVENPEDAGRYAPSVKFPVEQAKDQPSGAKASTTPLVLDAPSAQIPDYIIITSEELRNTFQRLADWKTKKGCAYNYQRHREYCE